MDETQKYYEGLLGVFASEGWKDFIEDMANNMDHLQDITTIPDEKHFWLRRGQVEMLQRVLSYESAIKNSYEDFVRDNA